MAPSSMYKPVENPLNALTSASQDSGVLASDDDQSNDGQTSDTVSHVSSSPMQHTSNSGFSPTLFSTPNVSNTSICSSCSSTAGPVVNPLVKAGLVPSNLADILAANEPEIQPKRRIIKARVLTEDEEKEKEDKELKRERRKEEREKENNRKKQERETKKKTVKRKRKKSPTPIPSGTDSN